MFDAHISFIDSLVTKGYVSEMAFLFKKGAIYDVDVWRTLQSGGQYGPVYREWVKLFFLMGLGCGGEKEVTEFLLAQDTSFKIMVLADLHRELYHNHNIGKVKYSLDGMMPMPFRSLQTKVAELYRTVLAGLNLVKIVSDKDALIVLLNSLQETEDINGDILDVMQDYALLNNSRLIMVDNFSNFKNFNIAQRSSAIHYHGTKEVNAFNCKDPERLKDEVLGMYASKVLYAQKNFIPMIEWQVDEAKKGGDKSNNAEWVKIFNSALLRNNIFGSSDKVFYIPRKVCGLPADAHSASLIVGFRVGIQTERMGKALGKDYKYFQKLNAEHPITKVKLQLVPSLSTSYTYHHVDDANIAKLFAKMTPDPIELEVKEISNEYLLAKEVKEVKE